MLKHQKQQPIVYNADGVDFTIYKTTKPAKSGPKDYWLLEDYSTGKRRLLNHQSRKAAERRADQIREAMVKGQAYRALLSHGQWQDVCMAVEILRSAQTTESLGSAIRSWVECVTLLNGKATPFDAVKFFLANHRGAGPAPKRTRFDEAAKLYHSYKVADGKSDSHCDNIQSRVNRLAKALPTGVLLDDLTAGQLEQVVVSFGLRPKTRNEYKILLGNLYTWAAKQNPPLVPKGVNPGKEMERCKVIQGEVEFLRVADLKKILARLPTTRPDLVSLVVLVCFAGLRPSEAARLDWSEVGDDFIRLPGKKSKTGYSRPIPIQDNLKLWLAQWRKNTGPVCPHVSLEHINTAIRRVVPITPNLKAWLKDYKQPLGLVVELANVVNAIRRLVDSTRPLDPKNPLKLLAPAVPWKHNALRHSFISYRVADVQNVAQVALEAGNSPHMIFQHYRELVRPAEAKAWFAITPESTKAMREQAEQERKARIVAFPAKAVKVAVAA